MAKLKRHRSPTRGRWLIALADFTPGSARTRAIDSRKNIGRRNGSAWLVPATDTSIATTFLGSKPESTASRPKKLRRTSVADTRRTMAIANSETTSRPRSAVRASPPPEPRPPDFSDSFTFTCADVTAGISADSRLAHTVTPKVKYNTRASIETVPMRGRSEGASATSTRNPSCAMSTPAPAPTGHRIALSVSS